MHYRSNDGNFTVGYSAKDAEAFSRRWPGSTVRGAGAFEFAANGDLVGLIGSANGDYDNDTGWTAFADDCRAYGVQRHGGSTVGSTAAYQAGVIFSLRRNQRELREALANLQDAASLVIERWDKGDLADAVRSLVVDRDNARAVLAELGGPDDSAR